jgi:hypothetical protein
MTAISYTFRATAILCAFGCAGVSSAPRQEVRSPTIHVGPNVRVSESHSRDTHYEVVIASHPRDSSRLIAASIIYPEGVLRTPENPKLPESTRFWPIFNDHHLERNRHRRRDLTMLADARTLMSIRSFNP